jgi:hypothetical protein
MLGNIIAIILIVAALAVAAFWLYKRKHGQRAFAASCCQNCTMPCAAKFDDLSLSSELSDSPFSRGCPAGAGVVDSKQAN